MRRFTPAHLVEMLLRAALGGIFIYAGAMKVRDPEQFAFDVKNYQLMPWLDGLGIGVTWWTVAVVVAIYLPWLEIFAGAALLVRRLYRGALLIIGGLILAFLGAIGSAWWRGLDITCGCFGRGEANATNYPQHLALNVAMLAATFTLAWLARGNSRERRTGVTD